MLRQWRLYFLILAVLAVLGGCQEHEEDKSALGEDQLSEDMMKKIFSRMDADADGNVSASELKAFARTMRIMDAKKENISELVAMDDENEDGKLQLKEVMQGFEDPGSAEGAPELTPTEKAAMEEYNKEFEIKFKAADRNADGALEGDEVRYFFFPEMHDEVIAMLASATMKRKDKDGDGKLSPEEFSNQQGGEGAEQDEDFHMLDKNENGYLTLQDLEAFEANSHHQEWDLEEFFAEADMNEDKFLSFIEFEAQYSVGNQQPLMNAWAPHMEL